MRIVSVCELNSYIKKCFEEDMNLASICVRGEISNFKLHYSGHMYMSIKDHSGSIRAVMFRHNASGLSFLPRDGMSIMAFGRVNVYERDGTYQLYIDTIVPDGIGQKYAQYEQLKSTLEAKGYFLQEHKKPLPAFPGTVGVVTSATGAAVRDIINVLSRRCPAIDIKIYPVLVQGEGAAQSIAQGIEYFNRCNNADVLIVGRGGGSAEDLWAFNEQVVADAIYKSNIPVVSAVGHETDYTIADFVADMRAPTPSAAAELVSPSVFQLRSDIYSSKDRLAVALNNRIKIYEDRLNTVLNSKIFADPYLILEPKFRVLDDLCERLSDSYSKDIESFAANIKNVTYKLMSLNPINVFERGYCVATSDNKTVKTINDVSVGGNISVMVKDGTIDCEVKDLRGDSIAEQKII